MTQSNELKERIDAEKDQRDSFKRKNKNAPLKSLKVSLKGKSKNQITQQQRNDYVDNLMASDFNLSD